jgi:hypothetical protein
MNCDLWWKFLCSCINDQNEWRTKMIRKDIRIEFKCIQIQFNTIHFGAIFFQSFFRLHYLNFKGPTETTCYCLRKAFSAAGDKAQNLGTPVDGGVRATVRTPSGEVALTGSVHQLYVAGPGLMRGYINRPVGEQPFRHFGGVRLGI